jgi:hypothetical protein
MSNSTCLINSALLCLTALLAWNRRRGMHMHQCIHVSVCVCDGVRIEQPGKCQVVGFVAFSNS